MRRRSFLASALAVLCSACVSQPPRANPPSATSQLPLEDWRAAAQAVLTNALAVLRTYDAYMAFRVAWAGAADAGNAQQLLWDPPSTDEWDEATRVSAALRSQAASLQQRIASAPGDDGLWRERRGAAEDAQELLAVADRLVAFRAMTVQLQPGGNGSIAQPFLAAAWNQWRATAVRWQMSESETVSSA